MVRESHYDKLFIGGDWVEPATGERFEVVSPVTEEPIASVASASRSDIDRAVHSARRALDEGWAASSVAERTALLARVRERLLASGDELAQLITDEMGCPITQSRSVLVTAAGSILASYIDLAPQFPFQEVRSSLAGPVASAAPPTALVTREPVGVVAAIVPWNAPLSIAIAKVAPALLAGCSVVLKLSPEAPLDCYLLAEILVEAGLPSGVVNVVTADKEVSEYLVSHRDVDMVSFTGSSVAGRRIASICGQDLRRVSLELGGKSAAIVLDDADLDATIASLRMGAFRNSGQTCNLKTRILVSERRQREVLDRLVDLVTSMRVGDPNQATTEIGPLATARHRSVVESYLGIARDEGTKTVVGGGRPVGLERGWYVEPTVLSDVDPGMRVAQEEIFGPVVSVLTYRDEEDAVAIANNSSYGLNGAVFTSDLDHGLAIARRIQTGTVELNGNPAGLSAPTGGWKGSGIGREHGPEGLAEYTELKAVGLPLGFADTLTA